MSYWWRCRTYCKVCLLLQYCADLESIGVGLRLFRILDINGRTFLDYPLRIISPSTRVGIVAVPLYHDSAFLIVNYSASTHLRDWPYILLPKSQAVTVLTLDSKALAEFTSKLFVPKLMAMEVFLG